MSKKLNTDFKDRVAARMNRVDAMNPDVRKVVHDYGLTIVDAFLQLGITEARHMRHLITTIVRETRGDPSQGINGRSNGSTQGHFVK